MTQCRHPDRSVAQTAYLAFTAGYAPSSDPDLLRADLAGEAIRLVRVVVDLCPAEPAPVALLALMQLQHSRRDARDEIDEALARLADPVLTGPVSPLAASYIVQAHIAAAHATAASPEDTRWDRIVDYYDLLIRLFPSPSARLARAIAVAEASGPEAGLVALDGIEALGRHRVAAASTANEEAIAACRNDTEQAHLVERQRALPWRPPALTPSRFVRGRPRPRQRVEHACFTDLPLRQSAA